MKTYIEKGKRIHVDAVTREIVTFTVWNLRIAGEHEFILWFAYRQPAERAMQLIHAVNPSTYSEALDIASMIPPY